jgi:phospholipid/cholesterol/gamma-HCH transport system substrate-binding protein
MKNKASQNIKLGIFVLAGLLFLMLTLYMIGQDQNMFGKTFTIKARFSNVQGLVPGNNVRFAGIEAGTVKKLNILSDTLIEVTMVIDKKIKPFIRSNAMASIGTDGLMGNKVVNITASSENAPLVQEGGILHAKKGVDMDEMLQTLNTTNNDVAIIAGNLRSTILRINNSTALWKLLNDSTIPQNLKASAANVHLATARAANLANDLHTIVEDVKAGKGSVGALLKDTTLVIALNTALKKITDVGEQAGKLSVTIDESVNEIRHDLQNGKGTANAILKDSQLAVKINASVENIQRGTEVFSQNMEALKHNFLFRGYFRKLEKQKRKTETKSTAGKN